MIIARVVGNVVSTVKNRDYAGHKLLIVRPMDLDGALYGDESVVLDGADCDAGIGDIVLVIQEGGSARLVARVENPIGAVETAVAGIVDTIDTTQGSIRQ